MGICITKVCDNDAMIKKTAPPPDLEFEPEFVTGLKKIFEEMIIFNQVIGLKAVSYTHLTLPTKRIV